MRRKVDLLIANWIFCNFFFENLLCRQNPGWGATREWYLMRPWRNESDLCSDHHKPICPLSRLKCAPSPLKVVFHQTFLDGYDLWSDLNQPLSRPLCNHGQDETQNVVQEIMWSKILLIRLLCARNLLWPDWLAFASAPDQMNPKWHLFRPMPSWSDLGSNLSALEPNPRSYNFDLETHCVRWTWVWSEFTSVLNLNLGKTKFEYIENLSHLVNAKWGALGSNMTILQPAICLHQWKQEKESIVLLT